jgi:putative transposase
VFVVLEVSTRRIVHWNLTPHPTADWTAQQFRPILSEDKPYRYVIHDRDSIYSDRLDRTLAAMVWRFFERRFGRASANAFCERLVETIRRKCLDFVISLNEQHLRQILREWVRHYNRSRPHSSVGSGIPDSRPTQVVDPSCRHRIPVGHRVVAMPILAGLHHDYRLAPKVA